jgi:hypothetical protein
MRWGIAVIVALMTGITPSSAWANFDWVFIAQNDSQTRSYFVEWISIRRAGVMAMYWEKIVPTKNNLNIVESKIFMEDDCTSGQNRQLLSKIYFLDGTIFNANFPQRWAPINAQSAEESIHKYVCRK